MKFGTADSPLGATIAAFTPTTASKVLGTPGQLDAIDVKADPGVGQDQVVSNIRTALQGAPETANVEVISGKDITRESQNNLKDNLSFFNTFLLIFGVVALLVGSFIIFNTFSIIVAQRSRELALLRAIGAAQRQVVGSVLFEAVLVGITASIVGFVAGIFLAVGLKALLGALGLDIPASSIVIPATAVIWSFVTGMVVTVVAAVFPGVAGGAHPADRGDARLVDRHLGHVAPAGAVRDRHRAGRHRAPPARSLRRQRALVRRPGDGCRVPRRRRPRPDHRHSGQQRARSAHPQGEGHHGLDRP